MSGNIPELSVAVGFVHDTEALKSLCSANTVLSFGQVAPKLGGETSLKTKYSRKMSQQVTHVNLNLSLKEQNTII